MAERFWRDGFVVLPGLFNEAEIAPVSDEVDRVLRREVDYVPERDIVLEPGSARLRNAFRLHQYQPLFLEFAGHPALTGIVREILGEPLRLYGSQVFAKPALVGSAVPRHQDMPYWPFAPYDLLSAWIALDHSTVANGCVRFSVGSHRLGLLPHTASQVVGNSLGMVPTASVDALPEYAAEITRGSVVLHHSLTVHRSEANTSEQARRGLVYVYMGPRVELVDPARLKGPAKFPFV
ncbi:MAG: phytanoyl-CoA dioxygenase family protein [Bryobacteraceae bacterium]|nr:phytanoyl-CoA dioxygenase family protein [Bryobacteraceae bacterium]